MRVGKRYLKGFLEYIISSTWKSRMKLTKKGSLRNLNKPLHLTMFQLPKNSRHSLSDTSLTLPYRHILPFCENEKTSQILEKKFNWFTKGSSQNLSDTPWVTHFPLLTQFKAPKIVSLAMCLL